MNKRERDFNKTVDTNISKCVRWLTCNSVNFSTTKEKKIKKSKMKNKRNARTDKCGKKPPLAPVNHFDKFHHTLEEVLPNTAVILSLKFF